MILAQINLKREIRNVSRWKSDICYTSFSMLAKKLHSEFLEGKMSGNGIFKVIWRWRTSVRCAQFAIVSGSTTSAFCCACRILSLRRCPTLDGSARRRLSPILSASSRPKFHVSTGKSLNRRPERFSSKYPALLTDIYNIFVKLSFFFRLQRIADVCMIVLQNKKAFQ